MKKAMSLAGAAIGLGAGISPASAQSALALSNNDSVYDGNTFKIVPGKAKGDTSALSSDTRCSICSRYRFSDARGTPRIRVAAYILLQFGKERAPRLIKGAAYGVRDLMVNYKENPIVEKRLERFASVHGLPEQRFYNLLCMAYGADAAVFGDLVQDGYLPKKRADHCDYEYQVFRQAWLA